MIIKNRYIYKMDMNKLLGFFNIILLILVGVISRKNGEFSFLNSRTFFGGKRNEQIRNEIEKDEYLLIFPLLFLSSVSILAAGFLTKTGFNYEMDNLHMRKLMKETKMTMSLDDYLSGNLPVSK